MNPRPSMAVLGLSYQAGKRLRQAASDKNILQLSHHVCFCVLDFTCMRLPDPAMTDDPDSK